MLSPYIDVNKTIWKRNDKDIFSSNLFYYNLWFYQVWRCNKLKLRYQIESWLAKFGSCFQPVWTKILPNLLFVGFLLCFCFVLVCFCFFGLFACLTFCLFKSVKCIFFSVFLGVYRILFAGYILFWSSFENYSNGFCTSSKFLSSEHLECSGFCCCNYWVSLVISRFCLIPAGNYMFKVNNRNTRTRCEICSKLTIKTPERCHLRRSGVFIVNFEHISHLVLVFLLLTLNM